LQASTGSYISWNGTTGSLTDGIIPATNGYFVHVTATGQSVTMETADQLHSSYANYKGSKVSTPETFVITVSGTIGESNEYIQFRDDATTGFDHAIDAYKLFGFSAAPQIYTSDGDNLYSINCLPLDISNYNLPVSVKFSAPGKYKLTFSGMDKVKNYDIKLEDLQTHEIIPVNAGTSYSFSFKKGDDPNRFVLHINGVTAVPSLYKTDGIQIFSNGNTVYLLASGQKNLEGKVSVLNMLGQVVYSGVLNGANRQQISLNHRTGIYFVRLEENNRVVTKKVFIK